MRQSGIVVDLRGVARMLSHDRRDCGCVHGRWIALRSQCRWLGGKPEDAFRGANDPGDAPSAIGREPLLISHPPELARVIRPFLANADLPVIGTAAGPEYVSIVAVRHCHYRMKMRVLAEAGYGGPIEAAYSDSRADLPLLQAARKPVVVNPKPARIALFRRVLPAGTPILNWGCPGRGGEPV